MDNFILFHKILEKGPYGIYNFYPIVPNKNKQSMYRNNAKNYVKWKENKNRYR